MSQQINLLDPALLTHKDWFSPKLMLLLGIGVIVLLLGGYFWFGAYVAKLKQQQQQLAVQVSSTKLQLDNAINARVPKQPDARLQRQILQTEQQIYARQQVLSFLQQHSFDSTVAPSLYLEAFARHSMADLWLTGFVVDDAQSYMEIRGRTVKPELVGRYLASLSVETVLKGRAFSSFETRAQELESGELFKSPAALALSQPKLRVSEFVLKSKVKVGAAHQEAAL